MGKKEIVLSRLRKRSLSAIDCTGFSSAFKARGVGHYYEHDEAMFLPYVPAEVNTKVYIPKVVVCGIIEGTDIWTNCAIFIKGIRRSWVDKTIRMKGEWQRFFSVGRQVSSLVLLMAYGLRCIPHVIARSGDELLVVNGEFLDTAITYRKGGSLNAAFNADKTGLLILDGNEVVAAVCSVVFPAYVNRMVKNGLEEYDKNCRY